MEMVRVGRARGVVLVHVNENVADKEHNWGFHTWNFEATPRQFSVLHHILTTVKMNKTTVKMNK
jgi:hypothetical protein